MWDSRKLIFKPMKCSICGKNIFKSISIEAAEIYISFFNFLLFSQLKLTYKGCMCILEMIRTFIKLASKNIWRPSSLSGLTPIVFNTELNHLGSETSIYMCRLKPLWTSVPYFLSVLHASNVDFATAVYVFLGSEHPVRDACCFLW